MGVPIRTAEVSRLLSAAVALGAYGSDDVAGAALDLWREYVRYFQQPHVPRTYLPVVTTMLVAKALHGADVDVHLLQSGAGAKGYSASSVASVLQGFAKAEGIDLRSTSQSPFNNQPFTFKESLGDVEPGASSRAAFLRLRQAAAHIEELSDSEALQALATTFVMTRRVEAPVRPVDVTGGLDVYRAVCRDIALFVENNSDGGRVGQALCAALLDLQHDEVVLGLVNDPDARIAGDVHVMADDTIWLWCEVKQKVVVTGDLISFMRKVAAAGGQRCLYLALANYRNAAAIDVRKVQQEATAFDLELVVAHSPENAIALLTQFAPGRFADVAARLLRQLRIRLVESDGNPEALRLLDAVIDRHATTTAPGGRP